MFKSTAQVLFDFRAVTIEMAVSLCFQLPLQLHSANRAVRMADGSETIVLAEVHEIPITVGGMTHAHNVLVLTYKPFSVTIGRTAMKSMRESLDFDKDIAFFSVGGTSNNRDLAADNEQDGDWLSKEVTSERKWRHW